MPSACGSAPPDHRGGLVCDNVIDGLAAPPSTGADFVAGISLSSSCDTWVMHNTIVSPVGDETSANIIYGDPGTFVHLANNLSQRSAVRSGNPTSDPTYDASNVAYAGLADFVDSADGNFHLGSNAAEMAGTSIAGTNQCAADADGKPRDLSHPTPGAYER